MIRPEFSDRRILLNFGTSKVKLFISGVVIHQFAFLFEKIDLLDWVAY